VGEAVEEEEAIDNATTRAKASAAANAGANRTAPPGEADWKEGIDAFLDGHRIKLVVACSLQLANDETKMRPALPHPGRPDAVSMPDLACAPFLQPNLAALIRDEGSRAVLQRMDVQMEIGQKVCCRPAETVQSLRPASTSLQCS